MHNCIVKFFNEFLNLAIFLSIQIIVVLATINRRKFPYFFDKFLAFHNLIIV